MCFPKNMATMQSIALGAGNITQIAAEVFLNGYFPKSSDGYMAFLTTVTPDLSRLWLGERNHKNRPVKDGNIKMLARAIQDGFWMEDFDPIKFDWDGQIISGQHRLMACVEAGTAIPLMCVFNLSPEARFTADTGLIRSARDGFAMLGRQNASPYTSALKLLWMASQNKLQFERAIGRVSMLELQQFEATLDKELFVTAMAWGQKASKWFPTSSGAALYYLFAQKDPTGAYVFFDSLVNGIGLSANDPIRLFRRFREGHAKVHRTTLLAYAIKAWNYTREGIMRDVLAWKPAAGELFPEIR